MLCSVTAIGQVTENWNFYSLKGLFMYMHMECV